jgi:CubicO group peptidase (beta-lactamase class C family)
MRGTRPEKESTMKHVSLIVLTLVGLVAGLVLTLFVALSIFDSPTYAWRILAYQESDTGDIDRFPARIIQTGDKISTLPAEDARIPAGITWLYRGQAHTENLQELLVRTETAAFVVVRNDKIILQVYRDSEVGTPHTSFSAAKSFSSALIGAAIADGHINSVDDPVIQYIPEVAGRGLDKLTIRDLLLMNSGIRYTNDGELPFYQHPFGDDALSYYSPDLRRVALGVQARGGPIGAAFRYNNYHLLLEGLILERATGKHVAEYLQERFWKPMGAEYPASWSLDSDASGFEKMESGINAAAVDFARFGLIFLHNGFWNGTQILPEAWVVASTQPLRPDLRTWETMETWPDQGGYYKYHWWGLNNGEDATDFYAHGKYDEIVYVAPRKNMVIVRLGDATDEDLSWPLVLQALVGQMPAQ